MWHPSSGNRFNPTVSVLEHNKDMNTIMKRILFVLLLALTTVAANAQHHPDHHGPHHDNRPPRPQIECATHEQMTMTMRVLDQQSFEDKKLEVAKLCVTLGHFCVDDLARMATSFSFDENRLSFLIYAYDYCQDPQNYYSLRDSFSFRSNFDTLMDTVQPKHKRH